jgi:hypothetical protein
MARLCHERERVFRPLDCRHGVYRAVDKPLVGMDPALAHPQDIVMG